MKIVLERLRQYKREVKDDGFSLLELVVAVGILLVMGAGGALAYVGVQKKAREAAVQEAASEVFTGARAFQLDRESDTNGKTAEAQWNNTKKGQTLNVEVQESPTCLKVIATHQKGEEAVRQDGTDCSNVGEDNSGVPGDTTNPGENVGENVVQLETVDADGGGSTIYMNNHVSQRSDGSAYAGASVQSVPRLGYDFSTRVGTRVHVSDWLVASSFRFNVHENLEYVDEVDGMSVFEVVAPIPADAYWLDIGAETGDRSIDSSTVIVELPEGSRWSKEPPVGHLEQNGVGRWQWVHSVPVEFGGVVAGPSLVEPCQYRPGVLGIGSRVRIFWTLPAGYALEDVGVEASTAGLGSERRPLEGFNFRSNTVDRGDNTYQTDVPTNLLGGLLGLGSELEIALYVVDGDGQSERAIVATNGGLIADIGGSCRNVS